VEWLKAGIPLEEASKLLGHESVKTSERSYSLWIKGRQDRLDALVNCIVEVAKGSLEIVTAQMPGFSLVN
jgi:hypothetical protein